MMKRLPPRSRRSAPRPVHGDTRWNRANVIALSLSSLVVAAVATAGPLTRRPTPSAPPSLARQAFASRDNVQVRSAPSATAPALGTLSLGSDVLIGPEELPGWFPIVREWVNEDGSRTTRNLAFVSAADITFTDPRRVTAATVPSGRIGIQWSISDWLLRGRTLNTDAIAFDGFVKRLPPSSPTRGSFFGWYESWKPFYEKYIGPDAGSLAQSNVSLNFEEFDQALLRYKMQFDSIVRDYNTLPEANNNGKFQPTPDRPDTSRDRDGSGLPWWFWLASGVAVVGGGYLVYQKYQEGRAKLAYLDRHAPDIIDRFVPGGQGRAIAEFGRAGRGGRK